jgi:hypothetical protein
MHVQKRDFAPRPQKAHNLKRCAHAAISVCGLKSNPPHLFSATLPDSKNLSLFLPLCFFCPFVHLFSPHFSFLYAHLFLGDKLLAPSTDRSTSCHTFLLKISHCFLRNFSLTKIYCGIFAFLLRNYCGISPVSAEIFLCMHAHKPKCAKIIAPTSQVQEQVQNISCDSHSLILLFYIFLTSLST